VLKSVSALLDCHTEKVRSFQRLLAMPECNCCSICCGVLACLHFAVTMTGYLGMRSILSGAKDVLYFETSETGTDIIFTAPLVPDLEEARKDPQLAPIANWISIPDDQPTTNSIWIDPSKVGSCTEVEVTVTFACELRTNNGGRILLDSFVEGGCSEEKYPASVSLKPDCTTTREVRDDETGVSSTFIRVATFDGYIGNYLAGNPISSLIGIRLENNFIGTYDIKANKVVNSVWEWQAELIPDLFDKVVFQILLGNMLITCICCCCTGGIYFLSGSTHTSMPAAMPNVEVEMQQQPMQQPMANSMPQQPMQPMAYPMEQQPMQQPQY